MKQTLKIGVMLLVVAALATTGIALAQSDDSPAVFTETDESTAADPTPLRSRVVEHILEWLSPLVEDRTIDEDQAGAVADTLVDRLAGLHHRAARGLMTLQEAADFLEMTGRELVETLRDGGTLAELAGDKAEELIDHLIGLAEAHLDQAVADGRLTEEEAAERLAEATERLTDLMNGELEMPWLEDGLRRPGPWGGGRFGRGPGGGPCPGLTDSGSTDLGA